VGQGDSYEAALADVKAAIAFHLESFGADAGSTLRTICRQARISRDDFLDACMKARS
jgi:predicted RNase H-like HicB family nuclease